MGPTLVIELRSVAEVTREWTTHLSKGAAYVRGASSDGDDVTLVLAGPGGRLELAARIVYRAADGVGLELADFLAVRDSIEAWVEACTSAPVDDGFDGATIREARPEATEDFDPPTTRAQPGMPSVRFSMGGSAPEVKEHLHGAAPDPVPVPDPEPDEPDADEKDDDDKDPVARTAKERLRNLPVAQQLKVAREGELHERVALERMYGKTVWEPLLRNPRVTLPEVARISRMGALPRPLLELIVGNTAWLRSPEVRRALLGNLRLTADMIPRILRLLPKHELKLVPNQSAYALAVRDVARKLLKDQE